MVRRLDEPLVMDPRVEELEMLPLKKPMTLRVLRTRTRQYIHAPAAKRLVTVRAPAKTKTVSGMEC